MGLPNIIILDTEINSTILMLSKQDKARYRSELFTHLDGLVVPPVAYSLYLKGVLDYLLEHQNAYVTEMAQYFKANEGYLNIALRSLCCQGWLNVKVNNEANTVQYAVNESSHFAFSCIRFYKDVVEMSQLSGKFHKRLFEIEPFEKMMEIVSHYQEQYGISFSEDPKERSIQEQVLRHIEAYLVAPSAVALGMNGMFHKYFMEASFSPDEYHKDVGRFTRLLDFFTFIGWFKSSTNGTYSFTDKGLFFAKRASAYGVTTSYLPTFRKMDELLFGNANILWNKPKDAPELHVDRVMNVWGSGGAHGTYFKKVDEIIISIFNKPINRQPKGIVDMGCGNGAYLQHLFEVIEQRTLRGTMLEEHPLFLVGADYNAEALRVTRANLIAADIWAKVIFGDIGNPASLAQDLKEDFGIELTDLLSVRSFLDHNRIWEDPDIKETARKSSSKGAFAYRGKRISNNAVEENLYLHFKKWAPYVEKFGLLVIELHTIAPELTARNLGKTAATAYDSTHGFSDQYIVELEVFERIAVEAGLQPQAEYQSRFPDSELATVSINLLKG